MMDREFPRPAARVAFLEGPAVHESGMVYFSDIVNNRILKFAPATNHTETFRQPSGRANGLLFDHLGRLLACEGNEFSPDHDGNRRVTRTDLASEVVEVLCDQWQGQPLNSPNDIACTRDGHLFFTDPCYEDRSTMRLDHESVYHIDPDGRIEIAVSQPDIQRPNGVAVSPDQQSLYIIDSCPVEGGNRKVWAFDLSKSGRLSGQRLVFDFGRGRGGDGMAVDRNGLLYVAAGILQQRRPHESTEVTPGIYRITPDGSLRDRIPIVEDVLTNVTFGGPDLRTLYITAGKTLFTTTNDVPGWVVHRSVD
jgi:gluconolactonase